jgi:hypothetical protein
MFVFLMRWILLLVLFFSVSFVSAVIPDDCDYSMEAYWKMDGDATDSVNGHDGIGWPGGTYVLKSGNAANFDGSSKISISDIGNVLQFGFTIEMWIQKTGIPTSDSVLFKKGDYLVEYLSDGTVRGSVAGISVFSGVLSSGVPYHVALVWEPNTKILALYINGVSVDFGTLSSPSIYAGNVELGDGFVGLMDEVAVYSRAFDDTEVWIDYSISNVDKDYCEASGIGGLSTTKAEFNIAGCALPGGNGLAVDTCSRREIDGEYYCDSNKVLWETREGGLGCSKGSTTYNLGDSYCCPAGMFCNETSSGVFMCDYRLQPCSNATNEADCKAIGCVWLSEEGICADGTRDYSCAIYDNQEECEGDVWNLGRTGIGTEFCGSYQECEGEMYTIPYESCECRWIGGVCELYMEGAQTYYDDDSIKEWFSCSKDYAVGLCIDGEQDVSWVAVGNTYNGFDVNCLDMMGCSDGSSVRACGEPIVKLPGFSLFAFFCSIFIIGLYYFIEGFK